MASVLSGIFLLGAIGVSQVTPAVAAPVVDPGPEGSFSWKGLNWDKRFWQGGPHYNGKYNAANVTNPDANGYVKLNITNLTGVAPEAAEFQTTRRGFGYGTYTTTVEKDTSALQKEVVWGCLFTYDPDSPPGMNEIDLCEASAWGGGAEWGESWPVEQGHGYWFDASKGPGKGNNTISFLANNSSILTHKMVWEPGKITFETYAGENYTGPLLKRTVLEGANIPVPAKEHIVFNFWVTGGGGGKPNEVKPESVTIRDFSFTPASTSVKLPPTSIAVLPSALEATANNTPEEARKASEAPATVVPTTPAIAPEPKTSPTNSFPTETKPDTAIFKSFTRPIQVTATSQKYVSDSRTIVRWTGTSENVVQLYINGEKKTFLNSGAIIIGMEKDSLNTYKLCDSKGCSATVTSKTSK